MIQITLFFLLVCLQTNQIEMYIVMQVDHLTTYPVIPSLQEILVAA